MTDNDAAKALARIKETACTPPPFIKPFSLDDFEIVEAALTKSAKVDGLLEALNNYYLPQLKFSMGSHRAFAIEHADNKEIASLHHGAANAFETSIGCIEEALQHFNEEV